jgi:hypothetical protein
MNFSFYNGRMSTASCNSCRTRPGSSRRKKPVLSLCLLMAMIPYVHSQLCEPVRGNSWAGLTEAINRSHGFAILCPFHINGERCPAGNESYEVMSTDLYVMCDSVSQTTDQGADCVINCPGTHFTVFPDAALTVDNISLEGSKTSAIQVKQNGVLTTYNAVFSKYVQLLWFDQ